MFIRKIILLLVSSVLLISVAYASYTDNKKESARPKVGLVMSGGGAKGFAYVGLLKVLEEVNMPIDYIGGASMGAITAALYSVGYSPEEITKIIRNQDWNSFISDVQERKYISYEEKVFSDKYIFSMPIEGKGITLSNSLNTSFNIDLMLNKLFAAAAQITDFNDLAIPFLCIGTDLLTGEAVVLTKGNLARAVRASMAIPGYFSPTEYDGRFLIDGGVVNNYPAEQVKAMGADIIIGADVQSGLKSSIDEISSVTAILDQIISFNRVDANIKGIDLTDYYVKIGMSYGMLDFDKYDTIIAIGERVAREHYSGLKALADSLNALDSVGYVRKMVQPLDSIIINEVVWSDMELNHSEQYQAYFDDMNNKTTALSDIENNMLLLNGTGIFNDLRYEFVPHEDKKLDISIETGNVNKGSLAVGLQYDNIYGGNVLLNLSLRNINGGKGKLFTDLVLGQNPRLKSMFIINNGFKPGFGLSADLYALNFSEYEEGDKVNKWDFDNINFAAFMPLTIKNNYLFKAGFQYELFRFKQDVVVDPDLDAYKKFADYGNLFVTFDHDSRNNVSFPTKGQLVQIKAEHVFPFSNKWSDILANGTIVSLRYNWYVSIGDKLVYKPELFAGYTFTEKIAPYSEPTITVVNRRIPGVHHLFGFGGTNPNNYVANHISFTGFNYLERMGLYAGKFSTNFEYNFYPKFYASLLSDVGILEYSISNVDEIKMLFGYGAKVSYNSFVGPIEVTLSSSNIDTSVNVFFNVGFWF